MIIRLKGATFTTNIGTLDSWSIKYTTANGSVTKKSGATSIKKDDADGEILVFEFDTAKYTYKSGTIMSNGVSAGTISVSGNTITVNVNAGTTLSGKVEINFVMEAIGGGEVVDPEEPEDPVNPPSGDFIAVPYTSQLSTSGLSKTDGSILSSGTGYVNVYENLDFSKTYYASGYAPAATGNNAIVCYYKADGTFISSVSSSDWGVNSEKYKHRQLTIPVDTAIIKLFGRTNAGEGCTLEIGANYILISHSEINKKSNLTKSDGTLGTSSTGVVKTYNNIDASKTYVADGFCPNATGSAAFVCYYNSSNAFISHQDGNDFGLSSKAASKVTLTVPSGTSTIKLFGQGGTADPYLYTLE